MYTADLFNDCDRREQSCSGRDAPATAYIAGDSGVDHCATICTYGHTLLVACLLHILIVYMYTYVCVYRSQTLTHRLYTIYVIHASFYA